MSIKIIFFTILHFYLLMGLASLCTAAEHNTFVGVSDKDKSAFDIDQIGFYNRAAIIQLGQNKSAIVEQLGNYNRLMIVQVGRDASNVQNAFQSQKGLSAINYLYSRQTSADHNLNDFVENKFSSLNTNEARIVAENFIYAPELSRIGVGMLSNMSHHTVAIIQSHLEQAYLDSCNNIRDRYSRVCNPPASLFIISSYEHFKQEGVLGELDYKQNILSLTLGRKVNMSSSMQGGLAFNISDTKSNIGKENFGSFEADGYHLIGFLSWQPSNSYYLNGIASFGSYNLSSSRFSEQAKVSSNNDGWAYKGFFQTGYLFGDRNSYYISPFLSIGYSNNTTSGYLEEGDSLLTQEIRRQKYRNLTTSIGGILGRSDKIERYSLHSYLKLEIEREFLLKNPDMIVSYFNFSSDDMVITPVQQKGDIYSRISIGGNLIVNENINFSLQGSKLFGKENKTQYQLFGKLSVIF